MRCVCSRSGQPFNGLLLKLVFPIHTCMYDCDVYVIQLKTWQASHSILLNYP